MHAYHRLWQMEFQTIATSGRLSEIVGKKALSRDPIVRLQIIQLREGRRVAKYSAILALAGGEGYTPPLKYIHKKRGKNGCTTRSHRYRF